jgi:dynein heavy chain
LKILNTFRAAFREFKAILLTYFQKINHGLIDDTKYEEAKDDDLQKVGVTKKKKQREMKPKTWEFQEHLIFGRYDSFVLRLIIVKEFFMTAEQFLKLEKVEIGGIRGKDLSSRIYHVYEEFKEQFGVFSNRTYDSLDPHDGSFIKDYEKFKTKTFELDRKLGAVLGRSFDDCLVTESIFKLLQIFGSLIQRPLIAMELNERMPTLVTMLDQEIEEVKIIFNKQMQRIKDERNPIVDKNMPMMCGQLKWSQGLRFKMSLSIKMFKAVNHPVCYKVAAKQMFAKFKEMCASLNMYEGEVFAAWNRTITNKMTESLSRHLIIRNDDVLRVNFSYDISSLLREVSFLKKEFPFRKFPKMAEDLFQREEKFRTNTCSLEQTVNCYNRLKTGSKEVEYNLIANELKMVDDELERAEHCLNWNSEGKLTKIAKL